MRLRKDKWRTVPLGEVCKLEYGNNLTDKMRNGGSVPVYGSAGIVGWHDKPLTNSPTLIVGRKGSVGNVFYSEIPCFPIDTTYYVEETACKENLRWLELFLSNFNLRQLNMATAVPGLNRNIAHLIQIPLPPLEEQKQIAALFQSIETAMEQVDGQEKSLKALRKKLIDSISEKDKTISKAFDFSKWEKIKIEDVSYWYQRDIPNERQKEDSIVNYLAADHIEPGEIFIDRNGTLDDGKKGPTITKHFRKGDFLLSTRSVALHKAAVAHLDGVTGEKLIVIDVLPSSRIIKEFLPYAMHSTNFWNYAKITASGSVNKFSSWNKIKLYEFYLPPKYEQIKILEVFEQLKVVLKQLKQQKETLKLLKQKLLNEILG